jgi:hypothetical protein
MITMATSMPTPDPTGRKPPKQAPVQRLGPRAGSAVKNAGQTKKLPTGGRPAHSNRWR